jgi:hypothetical protein
MKSHKVIKKTEGNTDMDELIARLREQERLIEQQRAALEKKERELSKIKLDPQSGRTSFNASPTHMGDSRGHSFQDTTRSGSPTRFPPGLNPQDVTRLHSELLAAKNQINVMNEELAQTRITKHTIDQALSQSGDDGAGLEDVSEHTLASLQSKFAQLTRPGAERADTWPSTVYDESSSSSLEYRDMQSVPAGPFGGASGIWGSSGPAARNQLPPMPLPSPTEMQFPPPLRRGSSSMDQGELFGTANRVWNNQGHRSFASQSLAGPPLADPRFFGGRRASYNPGALPFTTVERLSPTAQFNPSPIGTPLATPTGNDFNAASAANIWGSGVQVYLLVNIRFVFLIAITGHFSTGADLCLHYRTSQLQKAT